MAEGVPCGIHRHAGDDALFQVVNCTILQHPSGEVRCWDGKILCEIRLTTAIRRFLVDQSRPRLEIPPYQLIPFMHLVLFLDP
jgi:hypothetical protein